MSAEGQVDETYTDGLAIASLVTGLLGVLGSALGLGLLLGPAALVMGLVSRGHILRSEGRMTGSHVALAGVLVGLVAAVLSLFMPILLLVFMRAA